MVSVLLEFIWILSYFLNFCPIFSDSFGFFHILLDSYEFFRILSVPVGIQPDLLVFSGILSNFVIFSQTLQHSLGFLFYRFLFDSSGFFLILPEFSQIISYLFALFWILQDSFQFSWNFVGFSRIFSDSLRLFPILSHSIGFFLSSSEFSWVLSAASYSLGFFRFSQIIPVSPTFSFGLFRIVPDFFLSSRNLARFSRILLYYFGFFKILSNPLGISLDSLGFSPLLRLFPILSHSIGFFLSSSEFFWVFSAASYSLGFFRFSQNIPVSPTFL